MDSNRRRQIEEVYHAALERDPEIQTAFLDGACRGDPDLRREVESLLARAVPVVEATATLPGSETAAGALVGAYRIVAQLGAGGMGVVYRAHDTKLGRDVAIKSLPREFARDPERLARFRREARVLASLNHPNIGAIYGLEEWGGSNYLVLELVGGETLRGPMPVARVLHCARQIAEALEAAHKNGIVHRDLKPANVKITLEGRVKVLDFGLAKAVQSTEENQYLSQSATVTGLETVAGRVMGTPRYMSPEQARGEAVDKRTDIWAFGCVLYELLAGKAAFPGETQAATIAAIQEREPDFKALPAATPALIRELLRRCLRKDVAGRLPDIAKARAAIEKAEMEPAPGAKRRRIAAVSALLAILAIGAAWWVRELGPVGRFEAAALKHATFTQLTDQPGQELYPSLAPDGKSFVYASRATGNWDIYSQRAGGKNPVNLTRDSPADDTEPAFSPDGERIAFRSERDGGGIFVMGATGENVKRITDFGYNPAWSPDGGEIVCASTTFVRPDVRLSFHSQLISVKVATGEKRLITPGVEFAMQPHWSPHAHRIAYWSVHGTQWDIWTIAAGGGKPVPVTNDPALDWNPVWSPDGTYLYFASDRGGSMNLWRVPIDERSGKVLGEPEPVTTPSPYSAYISFSRDGRSMAYAQRTFTSNIQRVAFDPSREIVVRQPLAVTQGSGAKGSPDISPDGEWIVFASRGKREDLFVVRKDGAACARSRMIRSGTGCRPGPPMANALPSTPTEAASLRSGPFIPMAVACNGSPIPRTVSSITQPGRPTAAA